MSQWQGKGPFGPPLPAQAQTVRDYYSDTITVNPHLKNNFRFPDLDMLGDAFKIENLAVDTTHGPMSDGGWNLFMTQYFANDFVKKYDGWDLSDVEAAFVTWIRGLRTRRLRYDENVHTASTTNISVEALGQERNLEHAREQTRRTVSHFLDTLS